MGGGWREPNWLIGVGVALLLGGYVILGSDPAYFRGWFAAARVAFYGGLAMLVAGVVIWLRRPPRPDPAEVDEETPVEE